ncbi:hypothetical protein GWI33_000792 [Rhynchophorus ferrugineus]|uniref:Uncharacterized protein n=1 Tax=Rhynchophorus ferrugineus TaxID=354439 RepID=A0A834M1Z9_RHYFE|nr:hypothetical protein GWI33_000808 [Rhynchophorus ferrugineus]KAF7263987.1 hypothetical protein GWI33_000792 [Rhynchophorus ferrugineus]
MQNNDTYSFPGESNSNQLPEPGCIGKITDGQSRNLVRCVTLRIRIEEKKTVISWPRFEKRGKKERAKMRPREKSGAVNQR